MLVAALEAEVTAFIDGHKAVGEDGRRLVVRNGYLPEREVLTGAGPLPISAPRVRDKRGSELGVRFTSAILPRYLRRSKTIDELVPWLYLRGISTGQMQAIGYANQLAANQANQLLQIRGLLIAQQNAATARMQAQADLEAQQQAAGATSRESRIERTANPRNWLELTR